MISNMFNPQNYHQINNDLILQRTYHLDSFFHLKTIASFITRNIMFLAISIFDKFLSKQAKQTSPRHNLTENRQIRIIACIWIALKFQDKRLCSLNELLQKTRLIDSKGKIIQMESEILLEIDYEIPSQTAFTRLTTQFYLSQNPKKRLQPAKLAAKALSFLQQAIKYSIDFSLCSQLGLQILNLYIQNTLTDPRIKKIYILVKNKKDSAQVKFL